MLLERLLCLAIIPLLAHCRRENDSSSNEEKEGSDVTPNPRETQIKQLIFGFLERDIDLEFPGEFDIPYGKCRDIEITYFELPNIRVVPDEGEKSEILDLHFDDVKVAGNLACGVCATVIWDICTDIYPAINLTHVNFDVLLKAKLDYNSTGDKVLRLDIQDCQIELDFEMNIGSEGFMGWVASTIGGIFREQIERGVEDEVTDIGCEMVEKGVYEFNKNINDIVIPKKQEFRKIYYKNMKLKAEEAENHSAFPISNSVIGATLLLILAFFQ